ncbi:hypothetical protein [Aureimonas sp. AU22]|uniref:hypothetical protein n=1 Tax=Aureimonas sp. AU22 TaxID=1638162 RepID=UPI000A86EE79|nr:hypothetical protein [Aureimonas sp. AU22]
MDALMAGIGRPFERLSDRRSGSSPATIIGVGPAQFVEATQSNFLKPITLLKPANVASGDFLLAVWMSSSNGVKVVTDNAGWFVPGPYDIYGGYQLDMIAKISEGSSEANPVFNVQTGGVSWWGVLIALRDTEFVGFPSSRGFGNQTSIAVPYSAKSSDVLSFVSARSSNVALGLERSDTLASGQTSLMSFAAFLTRDVPPGVQTLGITPLRTNNGNQQAIRVAGA